VRRTPPRYHPRTPPRTDSGELSTRSEEIRTRRTDHNVRLLQTGTKRFHQPVVGELTLTFEMMGLATDPPPAGRSSTYTSLVSSKDISDELVQQVADELRARYGLDHEDVRTLGARLALAEPAATQAAENIEYAERFTAEHRETFDRLSR
jgi:hypothetical protein